MTVTEELCQTKVLTAKTSTAKTSVSNVLAVEISQ